PDDLPKLTSHGKELSFGKKEGYGLGLRHAYTVANSCGGSITIESSVGKDTIVTITLPLVTAPVWFRDSIKIQSYQKIIALDDDPSIHHVWSQRFNPHIKDNQIELKHLSSTQQFRDWINQNQNAFTHYLFL